MTNAPPRRGVCSACGHEYALKVDGTLRGHGWRNLREDWCPGSWEPPATSPSMAIPWAAGGSGLRSGVTREGGEG